MKKILFFCLLAFSMVGCSDYDDQEFTVLLPDAGEDQIVFTEETGTTIQLSGMASTDVNELGFTYQWEIVSQPEEFPGTLSDPNIPSPTLTVPLEAVGRYRLSLTLFRGAQQASDFINIDVNPALAQILFVNAIDGETEATWRVPSVEVASEPVAPLSTDSQYYNIDLDDIPDAEGNVTFEVDYGENTLSLTEPLEVLSNYTLCLVGTPEAPELLLFQTINNLNTLTTDRAGLTFLNLAPETNDIVLFVDAVPLGFPTVAPLDNVLLGQGESETFGALDYQEQGEVNISGLLISPLDIWATAEGARISNNANITLPSGQGGGFGTFILFADDEAENGQQLVFVNNVALLPQ
ncbi:MAG: hypothetical protein AAF734_12425 [Bacteroidota bacterium]